MRRSRGVLVALVVCSVLMAACDQSQPAGQATAAQTPAVADRDSTVPIQTPQAFDGEVTGFTPPPLMGSGDAIVPAPTQSTPKQAAKDEDDISPQETNPIIVSLYHGPWSLEERIIESDTVARGRLRSAFVGAAYSHEREGDRYYRPVVEFIYDVSEYLKGNGSDEIVVATSFFGNPTDNSEDSVLKLALSSAERMTNHMSKDIEGDLDCDKPPFKELRTNGLCLQMWELGDNSLYGEEWLIFLLQDKRYPSAVPGTGEAQRNKYAFIGEGRHRSPYAAAWMPSVSSVSGDDALSDERHFTTGPYAERPSQSIFAISEVRESIADIDALLKSGEEIPDYKYCLSWMYYEKRVANWDTKHYGRTYTADELAELREWIRDEGCAEAMSAVELFENLRK